MNPAWLSIGCLTSRWRRPGMRRDFQSMVGTWGAGIQGCGLIPSASARNRSVNQNEKNVQKP